MKKPAECRNRRSRWTLQEMRYVEKHYANMTAAAIGAHLGRPRASVACMAHKLGVGRAKALLWTEAEKAVIHVHYAAGMSMQDIMAKLPGRTRGTILAMADKLGIKRPSRWSQKECGVLKAYYPSEGRKVAERLPGRTADAVKLKACELGIEYQGGGNNQAWYEDEWDVLKKNLHLTLPELALLLPGRSLFAIEQAHTRLTGGITRRNKMTTRVRKNIGNV
ncbi:hypothetical protein [Serratia entomophila]|uniref:hypothetical protein n=1 Tax=Serratia entomophila TaxID=42906 RepID=UPI00217B5E1D|nr:hypothetical protein [Serratia entomophila]CAI1050651.1 Uncharacterised protein [Serratia entomophila]CAI1838210.1 Uncharacterised protein [Serratia entomophila]CAI2503216.1 Uncharacterised protein [Serratia entomophila]